MTQSTCSNLLFHASVHSSKMLFKNSVFKYERTKFAKLTNPQQNDTSANETMTSKYVEG